MKCMKRQSIDNKGINKESSAVLKTKTTDSGYKTNRQHDVLKPLIGYYLCKNQHIKFVMKPFVTTITLSNYSGNLQFTVKTDE